MQTVAAFSCSHRWTYFAWFLSAVWFHSNSVHEAIAQYFSVVLCKVEKQFRILVPCENNSYFFKLWLFLPVWFWSASPRMWVHYGLNFVLLFKHCVWCWNITWYVVCTQQALVDWWGNEFFSTHYHQSSIFNQRKCQKARWRDTESSQAQEVTSQTPALTDGKFCALRPSSLS